MEASISKLLQYSEELNEIYTQRSKCEPESYFGPWIHDEILKYNIDNLKKCGERLSHSCTKFSLIILNSPSPEAISSFVEEFMGYTATYISFYK